MRYSGLQVVFKEIPNEVSLAIQVTGCALRCIDCHSKDSWNQALGELLTPEVLKALILTYREYITCVLLMGGEWDGAIYQLLEVVRENSLKTALYTGLEIGNVDVRLLSRLDYIKCGRFIKEAGPLSSTKTNQKLIELKTGRILNHYFHERNFENDRLI